MRKILLYSDLHLEYHDFFIPNMENEKEITVILAGDIGIAKKEYTYRDFIDNTCDRFGNVIYVLGNHEFYSGNFTTALNKMWNATLDHENLMIVEKETVIIGDIAFICATMWTNFNNRNTDAMHEAELWMADYSKIRIGPEIQPWRRKLRVTDTYNDHTKAINYIFSEIIKQKEDNKKVIVVTHHLPSFKSISEEFRGDPLNDAYATELFEDIMDAQPDYWVHGHVHSSNDYMIGNTRVISNPRGYPKELNPEFNPIFSFEV